MQEYICTFSYDLIGPLDYYFSKHNIQILDKQYEEKVTYTYICEHDITDELMEMSKGKIINTYQKECIIECEIKNKDSYKNK